MLTAALTFLCTLAVIGMIVQKIRIGLLESEKTDLETELKKRVKDNFVLPMAKLQLWDKVIDRHGIEYTVDYVSLAYGVNDKAPHWSYSVCQSENIKILSDGYVAGTMNSVYIHDEDIGTKYFVRSGNTQATTQTQNLIKNAGGHHALHS